MVDRLGHWPSAEDRCPRWVGRGPDHQGHWARSACRTPRVGELRPFRPVSLKQRSFGSQQPELVGLQPEGSLPSDSTDRPAKGPTLQSPRRQSCRDCGGRCDLDTKADCLSPSLRPLVHRGCRCALRSPEHTPYLRARRQTNSPHGLNRPPERPSAEHATPAKCLLPNIQEPQ